MAKITWTRETVRWLEDIHDYIALDNSTAARKVVTGIYDKIQHREQRRQFWQYFLRGRSA